ncbi:glycine cleavage system protein R [Micromonospora endophytica]|uniref:Amino acid-binding protein n=1 Tax=Micromonospora endophytica TaxID=515350 RepID=A0A2W2CLL5_9ACTN|nr:ACT domain-containing protein [Micromonospora endophytica]PZF98830.1 amino acid-binding protein [Micromonospora endophytica]RIW46603.1 ACT domain-containing protein [Micromonospora endophytica]BCJ59868.1 amino acid-binding protein [Micromonospora endophytica]
MNELAITVIGRDRPGIVADVAEVLARLGANLTDSTMTRLRGHFAMTLICVGPAATEVEAALAPLAADSQLVATVRSVARDGEAAPAGEPYVMAVHGADRMGIVAAMTRVLTEAGGNVTDLSTRLAGSLYVVVAEVDLPAGAATALAERLAATAAELGVEVTLRPAEPDLL